MSACRKVKGDRGQILLQTNKYYLILDHMCVQLCMHVCDSGVGTVLIIILLSFLPCFTFMQEGQLE